MGQADAGQWRVTKRKESCHLIRSRFSSHPARRRLHTPNFCVPSTRSLLSGSPHSTPSPGQTSSYSRPTFRVIAALLWFRSLFGSPNLPKTSPCMLREWDSRYCRVEKYCKALITTTLGVYSGLDYIAGQRGMCCLKALPMYILPQLPHFSNSPIST